MKGVCFHSIGQVEYQEVPEPVIEHDQDAIVRVELAGMCGSDLHPYFGREVGLDPGTVLGHELVGVVCDLGPGVRSLQVGDRVFSPFTTSCGTCFYCRKGLTSRCTGGQLIGWRTLGKGLHGSQAERIRIPQADGTLVRIPEGMSSETALLLGDNLSTGFFCAEMANIDPEGVTVVIGCGTVGLLAIQAARVCGAVRLLAIDLVPQRRAMADSLGAYALPPGPEAEAWVRAQTDGRGADSVMELVGLPDAQRLAFRLLRPGGTMSVIGCHASQNFAFAPAEAYDKNLTYRTGRCPARHYMEVLRPRLATMQLRLDSLITHRFHPSACKMAYDVFAHQREGCIKALFDFREA
jgi:threonine dehydrogenase-like Zn-dependent dehydrogenase